MTPNHTAILDRITAPPSPLEVLAPTLHPMDPSQRIYPALHEVLLTDIRDHLGDISQAIYEMALGLEDDERYASTAGKLQALCREIDKAGGTAQEVSEKLAGLVDSINAGG